MKIIRNIVLMWLAWALTVLAFQALATARLAVQFPDRSQSWIASEDYQAGRPFLLEPFMNNQVAFDSEYYLAIAVGGYEEPRTPFLTPRGLSTYVMDHVVTQSGTSFSESIPLSYAFFPFYPLVIRFFAIPLSLFGLNEIATAALAGVIISALGTLMGLLALFDLTRDSLGEQGALRAAFYLLIFPTGFFLIQVYTEGLFVGLAFGCLAMLRRKYWLPAAILGICATLTRAVGVLLVIPMLISWFQSREWLDIDLEWRQIIHEGLPWRPLFNAWLAVSPVIVFLIWKTSYLGLAFDYIESNFFRRQFLSLSRSFAATAEAFQAMLSGANPQYTAYFITEFLGLAIGIIACIVTLKSYPQIAWFSMAVILVSWGSGFPNGIHRYVLGAPSVFVALAHWGANPVFDRGWTILSILLMGLLSMLFAFDMWVA
jgi:hypothetical protein